MEKKRVFSQGELDAMGARTLDLLQESIEAGDKEAAMKLSRRMYNEFSAMHDLYRDWITDLLTFVGNRLGDDGLYEALKQSVDGYTKNLGNRYADKTIRRKLEILAAGLRGHLQPFEIEEDDEKFTITPKPCGSGERQIEGGGYGPPRNFMKIRKPQPMTFGREDFPVYCAHCFFKMRHPPNREVPPFLSLSLRPGLERGLVVSIFINENIDLRVVLIDKRKPVKEAQISNFQFRT